MFSKAARLHPRELRGRVPEKVINGICVSLRAYPGRTPRNRFFIGVGVAVDARASARHLIRRRLARALRSWAEGNKDFSIVSTRNTTRATPYRELARELDAIKKQIGA